jgi:hypothetical protein
LRARQNAGLDGNAGLSVVALDAAQLSGLDLREQTRAAFPKQRPPLPLRWSATEKRSPLRSSLPSPKWVASTFTRPPLSRLGAMASGSR